MWNIGIIATLLKYIGLNMGTTDEKEEEEEEEDILK